MTQPSPIADLRVSELLAGIGGARAAPGAGAAGAVVLALGAACAQKAVAITLKHSPHDAGLQRTAGALERIAAAALIDADRDAAAFTHYLHAKDVSAASRLVEEGERVARLIDALLVELDAIAARIDASMSGDVLAARALAGAAREIQLANESQARAERQSLACEP